MNSYIKNLLEINEQATAAIKCLETTISSIEIKTEKDKANFGNLCIVLKGFRMVSEGTECLLRNEDVLKTENGEFYEKIKTDTKCCNCKTENGANLNEQNSSNNN